MFLPRITKTTTWIVIKNTSQITDVQHPIYNSIYSKLEFEEEFQLLLNRLNGHQNPEPYDYLGFYVEINPINGSLKFRDEDTKSIFIDWAVDLEIIPPLVEIHQGESISEQRQRQDDDAFNSLPQLSKQESLELDKLQQSDRQNSIQIQKERKFQRTQSYSQFYKDYLLLSNIWTSCSKNLYLITDELNPSRKKNLQQKIQSGKNKLNCVYTLFQKDYPDKNLFPEYNLEIQIQLDKIRIFLSN